MEVVKSKRGLPMDIISTLPQDLTTRILNCMPIRDALRTSILSRRWRYCWMRVSTISFDDKMFKGLNYSKEIMKHKLATAIFHILLLHTSPIVKFSLSVDIEMESELDQIIIYLSKSDALQELSLENNSAKHYKIPCSFFSLQGLWYLRVTNCHFGSLLTSNGFSKLTCLTLVDVEISSQMLKHLLTNCPLLGTLYLLGDAPKITGEKSLTFVELYECLPSNQNLGFSEYYLKYFAAGGMPEKLPNSSQVKYLILSVSLMDREALSCALYLIRNSPNLTTLSIRSSSRSSSTDSLDLEGFPDFKLDHLQNLWIVAMRILPIEFKFLKFLMSRASVLKQAFMEVDNNVYRLEDLKVFKELIWEPYPIAP